MNELKICGYGGALLYFKTRKKNAMAAYEEFEDICGRIQLNTDMFRVTELELQDKDFNVLDTVKW